MICITIDTNVLISATFWNGASAKVIEKVEKKEIILVLSEPILEEYSEVLMSEEIQLKIKNKHLEMKQSVQKISAIAQIIIPVTQLSIVPEDPDDNKVMECAVDGKVNYFLTKDKHLLKIKNYRGIKILTPEEFLELS